MTGRKKRREWLADGGHPAGGRWGSALVSKADNMSEKDAYLSGEKRTLTLTLTLTPTPTLTLTPTPTPALPPTPSLTPSSGEKLVAVISEAASTGISLHAARPDPNPNPNPHPDPNPNPNPDPNPHPNPNPHPHQARSLPEGHNRRKRVHLTLELPWSAEQAVQQLA
jgi:hypothetical protein